MIDRVNKRLSLTRQCQLLGLSRSSLYYQPATDNTEDLALMALIDRQFLETPYYGSRKMTAWLRREGHIVNRKRVRRLMRQMGLQVIWQKPNTSKPNPEHKVYPYLLRGLTIDRPNQVWATDITYIPMFTIHRRAGGRRRSDQHGRQRPLHGQCFRGTPVAQLEI